MATGMKICRVCGAEYKACQATKLVDGVFRWKDVACTPECGQEYLRRILASRGELTENVSAKQSEPKLKTLSSKKKNVVDENVVSLTEINTFEDIEVTEE